jgi:hypothetical protein
VVRTELARNTNGLLVAALTPLSLLLFKLPLEGAQTSLFLCLAPDSAREPGGYYADCAVEPVTSAPGLYSAKNAGAFLTAVTKMARSGVPMDTVAGTAMDA